MQKRDAGLQNSHIGYGPRLQIHDRDSGHFPQ